MEQLIKIGVDFIAEYGVLATVIFAMLWNNRKQSSEQNANMKALIANQASESSQQDDLIGQMKLGYEERAKMLAVMMAQSNGITSVGNEVSTIGIQVDAAGKVVEKNTESVDIMNGKLEQLEQAIRDMLQRVNEGQTNFEEFQKLNQKLSSDVELVLSQLKELLNEKDTQETPQVAPAAQSKTQAKLMPQGKEGNTE